MRRAPFRPWVALLPLALAACAPAVRTVHGDAALLAEQLARERMLGPQTHWALSGRLGVTSARTGGSGSFTWTQDGAHYVFDVRGPLSSQSFRLTGDASGAVLEGLDGGPLHGPDAQALMRKALGWDVPLRDLRAWVRGLRADGGPADLVFGANRLPAVLRQDGWEVDYKEWDTARQPPLPRRIFAEMPPYKVRLFIESWQFP